MSLKPNQIQESLEFPTYFEYQRERLYPVAKGLLLVGVLYVFGFMIFDYINYPDQRVFILGLRSAIVVCLAVIYGSYSWWKEEKHLSIVLVVLTVLASIIFFYLNLMVTAKNNLLIVITVYFLLSALALSPLIIKKHLLLGIMISAMIQIIMMLMIMNNHEFIKIMLPHLICLSVFTAIICTKLISSAKEHYSIAKNAHDIQFIDELTQVFNRKGIFSWTKGQMGDKQGTQAFSLLMIDLDFFKSINDNYGHAAGDLVIKDTAICIQNMLSKNSAIGRLGGEEFLVAVRGNSLLANNQLAIDINHRIKEQVFELDGEIQLVITASIGVTHYDQQTFSKLLQEADKNMYQAKNNGRDCVVSPELINELKTSNDAGSVVST